MRILIPRIRQGSLSGELEFLLSEKNHSVYTMPDDWDITRPETYPPEALRSFDVIVNCTGITLNEPVLDIDYANSMKVLEVNLMGAIHLTTEALRQHKRAGTECLVIHIGSVGARKVFTNCSVYCASKAGLAHFVECAGYEMRKNKVYTIGVHPANMKGTQMTRNVQSALRDNRGMSDSQVEGIYADASDPDDVARFILGIVSMGKYAWQDITGENYYLGRGDKR